MNLDDYTKELEAKAEEARRKAAEFDDAQRAKLGPFWKVFMVVGALVLVGALTQCVR